MFCWVMTSCHLVGDHEVSKEYIASIFTVNVMIEQGEMFLLNSGYRRVDYPVRNSQYQN